MHIERYEYSKNETSLVFQFESVGPNGNILKVVQFTPHNSNGVTYFNLGFGDWKEQEQRINDLSVTNNNDREKVLATVAATVIDFLDKFPDMIVYMQGSTPSRTRLYQIGISANYDEIASLLNVYGFFNGQWEEFERNRNYEAFLVSLK